MKMRNIILPALLGVALFSSCSDTTGPGDTSAAKVALYNGTGTWSIDVTALNNMFQWMGYDVTKVNSNIVLGDALSNYSILCIPGGYPDVFAEDFGPNGLQKIRDFVEDGGLYIGFCAGAMLAGNKSTWNGQPDSYENLAIANTSTVGPINSYENPSMLSIALNSEHPAVGESSEELVLFAGGSYCTSGSGTETIGSYPNGKRAIISAQYGQGRAILFCVHPEFEEDSDRDGVDYYDHLDDNGSDWDLVKIIAQWAAQ
ncbi:MAG: hypothetical protein K8S62_01300 [Candidatus Sabulitectum sp.]|nr:hypothetical protein [Candidatus Sabulitectum sp.]